MSRNKSSQLQPQTAFPTVELEEQLREKRRNVDFDSFDIQAQQLISMLEKDQIGVSPAYQRKFRWEEDRCSQFIESLLLGIPIPSLFMATNDDNTWEVVDGVQRIGSLVKFAGSEKLRDDLKLGEPLRLNSMDKLSKFNGRTFRDLAPTIQLHFSTRPLKVITLNDKSDKLVRYDLFERLNTGGVALSAQEIRDCVFEGKFADLLDELSKNADFKKVVKLTPLQNQDATAEECVLRFFAFREKYKDFVHDVKDFLNDYMESASKDFDYENGKRIFNQTFKEIARVLPDGIRRPGARRTTPLNLFEGVAVGASFALEKLPSLNSGRISQWLGSSELKSSTTGATNNRSAVRHRIEFCRDRFMGKPYVPSSKN